MTDQAIDPDLLDAAELSERALVDAEAHAARELTGQLTVTVADTPTIDLERSHNRHVFDQDMIVWRRLTDFEVWVDERGGPVGFRDVAGLAGCRWADITAAEIVIMASECGWLTPALVVRGAVTRTPGDGACLIVSDPGQPVGGDLFEVTVDPAGKRVVAVIPHRAAGP
jgi:hypothetical protein